MPERAEALDVLVADGVPGGGEVVEGALGVDRVVEGDAVDDEAERGELFFLALVVATATFTGAAQTEATRDGVPPIDLIDGDRLCDLLKQAGLGVSVEMVERITVNAAALADGTAT